MMKKANLLPLDAPATVAGVNAHLKARGREERLVRGRGYYYFVDGKAFEWFSSSVGVAHVDNLTVGQWLQNFDLLRTSKQNFAPETP